MSRKSPSHQPHLVSKYRLGIRSRLRRWTLHAALVGLACCLFFPTLSVLNPGPVHEVQGLVQVLPPAQVQGRHPGTGNPFRVELFRDENQDGKVQTGEVRLATTETDSAGYFSFVLQHGQSLVANGFLDTGLGEQQANQADSILILRPGTQAQLVFFGVELPEAASISAAALQVWSAHRNEADNEMLLSLPGLSDSIHWQSTAWQAHQLYQSPNLRAMMRRYAAEDKRQFRLALLSRAGTRSIDLRPTRQPRLVVHYTLPERPYLLRIDSSSLPIAAPQSALYLPYGNHKGVRLWYRPPSLSDKPTWRAALPAGLPPSVNWADFQAKQVDQGVQLRWQTHTELHSCYIDILRSVDGIHYESIGGVEAAGVSTSRQFYQYLDKQALAPKSSFLSYQLRVVHPEGTVTFSKPVSLPITGLPTGLYLEIIDRSEFDQLEIQVQGEQKAPAELHILNEEGALAVRQVLHLNQGLQSFSFSTKGWEKGEYYVRLRCGSQYEVQKITLK